MTEQMTGRKGPAGTERPPGAAAGPSAPSPRDLAARSPHHPAARDDQPRPAEAPLPAPPQAAGSVPAQAAARRAAARPGHQPGQGPGHRGAGAGVRARARRRGRGVRDPGRRGPAGLRPAARLQVDPAHPGPARAGRRPRGHRVRAGHRAGRRVHGDQRAGRHEPGDADRRRLHGLGPDGGHHRAGAVQPDRHRRLPGSRHLRHHDPDHQAQLPGHQARGHRPHHRRGLPRGLDRAAGAGPRRHRQGRDAGHAPTSAGRSRSTCPATTR